MYGFLVFLHVITCLLLVGVILMQASKGGGLAGTFGGTSNAMFGGRGAGSFLSKVNKMNKIGGLSPRKEIPSDIKDEDLSDDDDDKDDSAQTLIRH